MAELLPLLVLLPFSASLLCLLARFLNRIAIARIASALSIAATIVLLGLLLPLLPVKGGIDYAVGGWPEPLGIALHLDRLAWTASAIGTVIALCALLFAFGERRYRSDFYFFFLMLLAGMEGMILTGDLFNMFVFIEIVSISSYLLIAYSLKPPNLWASLRYLLLSSLSIAVFLIGLFLVYRLTGTFSLRLIRLDVANGLAGGSAVAATLNLTAAALVVGVGLKAAFVPLHTWLPAAHAAAPHPVSALLSGVMIKISFLAVWRVLDALGTDCLQTLFLWIGPLTALLGVGLALCQSDSKRLLAFHSVSQMGLIAAAFGAGAAAGSAGRIASLAHILSHSLFKSLLFLSVGAVIHLSGERAVEQRTTAPPRWLVVFFLAGALSISGLPPFNGFVSKTLVSSLFKSSPLLDAALRATAVGTAASMIKLSGMFRRPRGVSPSLNRLPACGGHPAPTPAAVATSATETRLSPLCLIALTLLALLCVVGGIAPRLFLGAVVAPAAGGGSFTLPRIYSPRHLLESLAYALAGAGVYMILRTRPLRAALKRVRELRLSLDSALLLVVTAVVLFAIMGSLLTGLPGSLYSVLFSR